MSESARRQSRRLLLRAAGLTPQAIADQESRETGKTVTAAGVSADIEKALQGRKDVLDAQRELFVALESERLDILQRTAEQVLQQARRSDPCPACGRSGNDQVVMKALDRLLRIQERRTVMHTIALSQPVADDNRVDDLKARRDAKLRELGQG